MPRRQASEQERIERLIANRAAYIREAFSTFVSAVQSRDVLKEVRVLLEGNKIEEALRVADRYIVGLADTINSVLVETARSETARIADQIASGRTAAITFNPVDARVVLLMQSNRLRLVRDFTAAQREVTRAALVDSIRAGTGPDTIH